MLTVVTLLLVFLKQVVGLQVFGLYQPLLFTLAMYVVGWETALSLLAAAILSHVLVNFLTKKITILVHAKIGAKVVLYVVLSFAALALNHMFGANPTVSGLVSIGNVLAVYLIPLVVATKLVTI